MEYVLINFLLRRQNLQKLANDLLYYILFDKLIYPDSVLNSNTYSEAWRFNITVKHACMAMAKYRKVLPYLPSTDIRKCQFIVDIHCLKTSSQYLHVYGLWFNNFYVYTFTRKSYKVYEYIRFPFAQKLNILHCAFILYFTTKYLIPIS